MNKKIIPFMMVIAGAVLFSLVFWQEKLGINTLLFDAFILAAIFYLYAEARHHAAVRWLLLGHLVCLAMIVLHNTVLSKLAFAATLLLLVGFTEYVHRSVWFATGSVLMNIIFCVASFLEQCSFALPRKMKRSPVFRIIRFAIFPLIILGVFSLIYLAANSVFSEMVAHFTIYIERILVYLSTWFSFERLLFLLVGLYITGSLLLKTKIDYFSKKDALHRDDLLRIKRSWPERMRKASFNLLETVMGRLATGIMALKNENTTGLISLTLLNLLLVVINVIDIRVLWFGFNYQDQDQIYRMVHSGTELLIVSIVLAMLVLLFFFKGNLNFYKRNHWLKYGAYAWILQNMVLVVSVFLRDYYYIVKHGMAYKRLGVLFFLLMVLIGLITVFVKIYARKTTYFLFRVNAWAAVFVMVGASCIHWDEFMAEYNIRHQQTVALDANFLLQLSDKTLPLLDRNIDALERTQTVVPPPGDGVDRYKYTCDTCYAQRLRNREEQFLKKQERYSWLSWNYADSYTKRYLQAKTKQAMAAVKE